MVLPGDLASPVACYVLQGLSCKHLGFPHQHCQGPDSTCTKGGWAWGKEQITLKKPKVPIQIVVERLERRATGYLTQISSSSLLLPLHPWRLPFLRLLAQWWQIHSFSQTLATRTGTVRFHFQHSIRLIVGSNFYWLAHFVAHAGPLNKTSTIWITSNCPKNTCKSSICIKGGRFQHTVDTCNYLSSISAMPKQMHHFEKPLLEAATVHILMMLIAPVPGVDCQ